MKDSAVAAIEFALETEDGLNFLRLWNEGDFNSIREEWSETPEAVFIGAEPHYIPKSKSLYPECEKLSHHREDVDDLMEFISFLQKEGITLAEWDTNHSFEHLKPYSVEREGEVIAAKFIGIDMRKVDKERVQIEQFFQSKA